ncbi:MAG: hypothetical protein R3E66_22675 [bacterium]
MKVEVVWGRSSERCIKFEETSAHLRLLIGQRIDPWESSGTCKFLQIMDFAWGRRPWDSDWLIETSRLASDWDEMATLVVFEMTQNGWVLTTIGQVTGQISASDGVQVIRGHVEVRDGLEFLLGVVGTLGINPETLSGREFESVVVDLGDERFRKSAGGRRDRWTWERELQTPA